MATNHPPPDGCFIQIWYDATNDIAYVQFYYGDNGKSVNVGTQGWYKMENTGPDSPGDFATAGVNPGFEYCINYRQGSLQAPSFVTRVTGPGPGSVQTYP
jgi:hypothetical protein